VAPSTAPTALELQGLNRSLESPDRATRRAAFEALSTLGPDALPAIAARLSALGQPGALDREGVIAAWSSFRQVQGITSPEAPVDLARGVLPALERARTPAMARGAELLALLRALEAQRSAAAAELVVRMIGLDPKLFRYEGPRVRERLSVLLLPALIRCQAQAKPGLRDFCRDSLAAMSVSTPGRAVQQDDVGLLADIIAAYGDTLTFEAMPVVVSYLTDERLEVQSAARRAVARFGRNAIWQIRERYLNATGKEADPTWGHQRILRELYRLHDEPKLAAFEAEIARAQAALERDARADAERALAAAMNVLPAGEAAKRAAPLYARLAELALTHDELEPALDGFRRALRLDPDALEADARRARVAYLEGELRAAQGIVDLSRFEHALALDPSLGPAASAFDELSGEREARERQRRRYAGFGAAALMAVAGLLLMRRKREPEELQPEDEPPTPVVSEAPESH
jgi:hypothetical protein